jgi:hypothetical protein
MKKTFSYILAALVLSLILSSCLTMKKDCQGRRHYRQPNGVYL